MSDLDIQIEGLTLQESNKSEGLIGNILNNGKKIVLNTLESNTL